MRFEKKSTFAKSWNKLPDQRREKAREALKALVDFLDGGAQPQGLGLKKLRHHFWEIRTDLKDRVLFTMRNDVVSFVMIGNHDDIWRALRR